MLSVCLCFSPGDRITVLDDSNEEWWRVSSSCWNSIRKKSGVKCSFFHTFMSNGMTVSDLNRSQRTKLLNKNIKSRGKEGGGQHNPSHFYPILYTHDTNSCEKQDKMLSAAVCGHTSTGYHGHPPPHFKDLNPHTKQYKTCIQIKLIQ